MKKLNRREFLAASALGTAGLVAGSGARAASTAGPNILFIMTDQQSAAMLSCAGNPNLQTPAMDRLAASGVRFERAYATNPVCVPSRFSLQTGLMPSAIGMNQNEDTDSAAVTEDMIRNSLGNVLRNAGYETVFGGKTHFPKRMRDLREIGYRNLTGDSREGLARACAEFIKGRARAAHDRPFFLFASFINPHDICYMAINAHARAHGGQNTGNLDSRTCEQVLDKARASGDLHEFVQRNCPPLPPNHNVPQNEPEGITLDYTEVRPFRSWVRQNWTEDDWRLHRWAYCRLTEMVDREIGIVLAGLTAAGLEDNTLIVFTSDHGDHDSAHKLEHKSILYEEAVRIPFIMNWKGRIEAGGIDDVHLVSNGLDLLPTLCDYAGIDVPAGRPGSSVRPLAERKDVPWRRHMVVESQNARMIRSDRFKYCVYESGRNRDQFTDLKNDPGEMNNVAGNVEFEAELKRHRGLLAEWVDTTGDAIGAGYIVK
ncbi:MAG TPA: sulfatase-like hydrolase/transferase [Candidatus Bathyarchaeia archaeon]|nr:sulfatase-like hydrolase/transferase [Candidatus Bathyarchaeia archaeon]